MVRWGLGFCAAAFAIMLLIPVPLRPDQHTHSDAPIHEPAEPGFRPLPPVAPPQAGVALMSSPQNAYVEVPAPDMPDFENIVVTSAQLDPPNPSAMTDRQKAELDIELGIRPVRDEPEVYRVSVPKAELRAGPSDLERCTSTLASGDRVEVLSRFADRWVFVRLADGKSEGYLDATLLSPAD